LKEGDEDLILEIEKDAPDLDHESTNIVKKIKETVKNFKIKDIMSDAMKKSEVIIPDHMISLKQGSNQNLELMKVINLEEQR